MQITEETEELINYEGDESETRESVSSGDAGSIYDGVTFALETDITLDDLLSMHEEEMEMYEEITTILSEEQPSIFEKPLEEYSTQETLLLLVFILLLWIVINKFIGGIFK